jgi:hypothetical protein
LLGSDGFVGLVESKKVPCAKLAKTDVQCKASLNRRLLLAVVLVGGDAEETKNLQC